MMHTIVMICLAVTIVCLGLAGTAYKVKYDRRKKASVCLDRYADRNYDNLINFLVSVGILELSDQQEYEVKKLNLNEFYLESLAVAMGSVVWNTEKKHLRDNLYGQIATLIYGWKPKAVAKFCELACQRYGDDEFTFEMQDKLGDAFRQISRLEGLKEHDAESAQVAAWYGRPHSEIV